MAYGDTRTSLKMRGREHRVSESAGTLRRWLASAAALGMSGLVFHAACGSSSRKGAMAHDGGADGGTDAGSEVTDAAGEGSATGPDGEPEGGPDGGTTACPAQPAGEQAVSLAGTWTFTPDAGVATTIEVPGGGWLAQGFHVAAARYARLLTVPSLGSAQTTLIELGAVNHQATLSIDGTVIATHTTSFTPSVFDVTGAVTPGGQHALTIDVKGRDALRSANRKLVPDAAGWSAAIPQGIFRSAVVRVVPQIHVSDAFVRTDVAGDVLSIDVSIANGGTLAATGTVSAALSSWNCDRFSYPSVPSMPVTLPPGQTVNVTLGPAAWGLGSGSYWWPNVPYVAGYRAKLHYASVTILPDGGAPAHTVPVRFGFRQIRQVGTHYELNGVRVNFRGDSLQGANYDSIKAAKDVSDAYDLVPGFLPPSATNPGWPRAVDNWERLNYDVARIHQEPASPYMLDVADEMGFLVIDETAIRGSNGDQDFSPGPAGGEPNMLAHAQALVLRDRNHPSVVRWSQCNEPELDATNSNTFQEHLYQAIEAVDGTRPVSADSSNSGAAANGSYTLITGNDFSVYGHYPGGLGMYSEQVTPSTTRPFGVGEFVWPADVTPQGMIWFGTAAMAMRRQDASDIRPYTLLSGWASFVPGITTAMMTLEPTYPQRVINHPHFGEDNLPDPWSNPIIARIQRGMNPVLVADVAFWTLNRASNANGDWPVSTETVAHGSSLTRQLVVFNDTFAGTAIDVAWEMRTDGATGPVVDQGGTRLDIPLGGHADLPITVTAPPTGSRGYLILQSSKGGQLIFREDAEWFTLQ
jgi:glycosyl hydrolase family 2